MVEAKERYKVAIIAPTCFYYQAALFRELAAHPKIDLIVFFCSPEALSAKDVLRMYKTNNHWGVQEEVLEGYQYKFLKNYSPFPSYLRWPFGLMNLGIWNKIGGEKPDVVILMSWMNVTWWEAILACSYFKTPFFYLTDANGQAEVSAPTWKSWIKRILLGKLLFPVTSGFLCAGTANRRLYRSYGVPEEKLVPFAYSWGYDDLLQISSDLVGRRSQIRTELGIDDDSYVVLFCGRLSEEKGPFQLLKAYHRVNSRRKALIFVGDGQLKQAMQEYVSANNVESVYFFGFQSRQDVPKFYAASDFLVLPSLRETWGIVVNEALCFGLPVIVSDQVGAGEDLVDHGANGFIFPVEDTDRLADYIERLGELPTEERLQMGARSKELMKLWVQKDLGGALVNYLDTIQSRK